MSQTNLTRNFTTLLFIQFLKLIHRFDHNSNINKSKFFDCSFHLICLQYKEFNVNFTLTQNVLWKRLDSYFFVEAATVGLKIKISAGFKGFSWCLVPVEDERIDGVLLRGKRLHSFDIKTFRSLPNRANDLKSMTIPLDIGSLDWYKFEKWILKKNPTYRRYHGYLICPINRTPFQIPKRVILSKSPNKLQPIKDINSSILAWSILFWRVENHLLWCILELHISDILDWYRGQQGTDLRFSKICHKKIRMHKN